MHDYAIDSRERVVVARILFMISALVSATVAALIPSDFLSMRWLLPIPSIALVFGVSYWAFDKWIWRWQFLRTIHLISAPDLRGIWTGVVSSSYSGFEKSQRVEVTIEQTWTRMSVRLNAAESRGWSVTASILANALEGLVLTYMFEGEPAAESVGTMQRFRGAAVLPPGYLVVQVREIHASAVQRLRNFGGRFQQRTQVSIGPPETLPGFIRVELGRERVGCLCGPNRAPTFETEFHCFLQSSPVKIEGFRQSPHVVKVLHSAVSNDSRSISRVDLNGSSIHTDSSSRPSV